MYGYVYEVPKPWAPERSTRMSERWGSDPQTKFQVRGPPTKSEVMYDIWSRTGFVYLLTMNLKEGFKVLPNFVAILIKAM